MMVRNTYQKPINAVNEIKGIEDSKNAKVKLFVMIAQLHHQNLTQWCLIEGLCGTILRVTPNHHNFSAPRTLHAHTQTNITPDNHVIYQHAHRAILVLCEYADSEARTALRLAMTRVALEHSNNLSKRAPIGFFIGFVNHMTVHVCVSHVLTHECMCVFVLVFVWIPPSLIIMCAFSSTANGLTDMIREMCELPRVTYDHYCHPQPHTASSLTL